MILRLIFSVLFFALLTSQLSATTYHVSKTGSDGNSGLSWGQAWATVDQINSGLRAGDTVRFGTGRWNSSQIVPPTGGTFTSRTVYTCSTFSSESWHDPIISSGEPVTGWTVDAGNVYRSTWIGSDCIYGGQSFTMTQSDRLLIPRSSRGEITMAGMFYHDGSTMYVWPYDNDNPNSHEMLTTCRPTVRMRQHDADHILFYGLDIRLGKQGTVLFSAGADSVFFEHCNLSGVGQSRGENPAVVMSIYYMDPPFDWGEYNTFVACSLSGAFPSDGTPPAFERVSEHHRGSGAISYIQKHMYFDSCVFYDLPGVIITFKNRGSIYSEVNEPTGNVARFSEFIGLDPPYGSGGGVTLLCGGYQDSVYGNTFRNMNRAAILFYQGCKAAGGNFVGNNSFYNCSANIRFHSQTADHRSADFTSMVKYNFGSLRWVGAPNPQGTYELGIGDVDPDSLAAVMSKFDIDSNGWHDISYNFGYNSNNSWSAWKALGFDVNGDSAGAGFVDPAGGDFSRPGASGEMNVTYGGQTWTVFGAVQEPCWPLAGSFLTGPAQGDTISLPILLQWQSQAGASQYQIQAASNSSFTSPEINETTISSSLSTSDLVEGRTYYWRVRAFDAAEGWSCWSSSQYFTVECPALPGAPALTGPTDGEGSLSQPVNLQWNNVGGASSYELELDQTINFGNPQTYTIFGTSSYSVTGLIGGSTYYWRVRACNDCGCGTYSAPRSFSVNFDTTAAGGTNLVAGRVPSVCGTYAGYSTAALTDGVIDPRGESATTWASDQSQANSHWVEFDFGGSVRVEGVNMHWAWNSTSSAWMTSQQFSIEGLVDTGFFTLASLSNTPPDSVSTINFTPTEIQRLRIFQPANSGPAPYPTILWLTELEILGGQDTIPPSAVGDLSALTGANHGEIDLSWLASGNDNITGMADHYTVQARLSNSLELAATTVNFRGTKTGGLPENNIFSGLTPGARYDITVTAYDVAGLSSTPVAVGGVYAGGILKPSVLITDLNSDAGSVTVSCEAVESYYSSLSYNFEVATDSVFSLPDSRTLAAMDNLAGPETFVVADPSIDHYWHGRAVSYSPADSSDWSRTIRFNIIADITYEEIASESDLDIRAGPSPVNFEQGQTVSFYLPAHPVSLTIMNVAGDRILERDGLSGVWLWNGQNSGGTRVAAGLYLWYVHDGDSWQSGKIMVQS